MTYFNWLQRNSNHDYCKKKLKVTGILRNYSIPAVINNLVDNFPATMHFDWPDDLIDCIKQVMGTPCSTPSAPEFKFELLEEATKQNLAVLEKYDYNLGRALEAQQDSPLCPGKEFKPPDVLESVFGHHPLWQCTKDFLNDGSKWPLDKISKGERVKDLNEALTFGNNTGASAKPELLLKLIGKDVKYGYSIRGCTPEFSRAKVKKEGLVPRTQEK